MIDMNFLGHLVQKGIGGRAAYLEGTQVGEDARRKELAEKRRLELDEAQQDQRESIRALQEALADERRETELERKAAAAKTAGMLTGKGGRKFADTPEGQQGLTEWDRSYEESTRLPPQRGAVDPSIAAKRAFELQDKQESAREEEAAGNAATWARNNVPVDRIAIFVRRQHGLEPGAANRIADQAVRDVANDAYAANRDRRAGGGGGGGGFTGNAEVDNILAGSIDGAEQPAAAQPRAQPSAPRVPGGKATAVAAQPKPKPQAPKPQKTFEQRSDELLRSGLSEDAVIAKLRTEGYVE